MRTHSNSRSPRGAGTCIAGLLALAFSWLFFGQARSVSFQGQVISVGILSFQDESGTNLPLSFGQKIARDLQQKMNGAYKDLLVRLLTPDDPSSTQTLSVEQVAELGKQQGVNFVVRGGLLSLIPESVGDELKVTIQVYADIISVETSSIQSVRAEGSGTEKGRTREIALSNAVDQLATSIYEVIVSPRPDVQADPAQIQETVQAEADEELQQLIAQAEELLSNSSAVSAENLTSLTEALEGLKAALASKANLLEQAQDTTDADEEIATQKQALQAAVSTIAEQISSGDLSAPEGQPVSVEKKNALALLNEILGETSNFLQKIQEMRATLRAAHEESAYTPPSETNVAGEVVKPPEEPTEEVVEEVSGVVTEEGEPVEGVTVTEVESGASATTDSNGSYVLNGIVAGKLAKLVVNKEGKQIAAAQIDLPRGHPAVADFELKPKPGRASGPALKIIPSTVAVKGRHQNTGALSGIVRDPQGRPVARALVHLANLAVARTDSRGQYVFLNVPAGTHRLTVHKGGLRLKSGQVQVAPKQINRSPLQFASADRIPKKQNQQPVVVRGAGTVLRGVVIDDEKRPIAGAKITVIQAARAVSVLTGPMGNFELRDLRPGPYKVLLSKVGYDSGGQIVTVRAGRTVAQNFQLKSKASPFITRIVQAQQARHPEPVALKRERAAPDQRRSQFPGSVTQVRPGQLIGQVIDAKTRKPVAGVAIVISGQPRATTNREGRYAVTGLAPGAYDISVRKSGFSVAETHLTLRPGETAMRNFVLDPKAGPPIRLRPRRVQ